jgi:hypothetical protein
VNKKGLKCLETVQSLLRSAETSTFGGPLLAHGLLRHHAVGATPERDAWRGCSEAP